MTHSVPTIGDLKKAVEGRHTESLKSFYAPDAVLTIIDSDNPPSKPRILRGREIAAFIDDVYSRDMTHTLDAGVSDGKSLAYVQGCKYSDGTCVVSSNTAELGPQGITRQTVVQAWDS